MSTMKMKTGMITGFALLALGCVAAFCRFALIMTFAAGFAAGRDSDSFVNEANGMLRAVWLGAVIAAGFCVLWQMRRMFPGLPATARRRLSPGFTPAFRSTFGFRNLRY